MATAATLLPDDQLAAHWRIRRQPVGVRQRRQDRRPDDPGLEILGAHAVRAASAEPTRAKLPAADRTHHRLGAHLAPFGDLLRPEHDWGVVVHALQAAEDPKWANGFHERLGPSAPNIAPTGDEKRLERVDLLPNRRESGRRINTRGAGGSLNISPHELAKPGARRRRSTKLPKRGPRLVVHRYASDPRTRRFRAFQVR
jgi:hypothetical protein